MSDLVKNQVEVEDLIARYDALRKDVEERLTDVAGTDDAEQVERLQMAIWVHQCEVTQTLQEMDRTPHLEIGHETRIEVHTAVGKILSIEDGRFTVLIPEQTISARWQKRNDLWAQRYLVSDFSRKKLVQFEEYEQPKPKLGDVAGVYVPVYLDGVIDGVHDDGSATVCIDGFTLQVLPDDSVSNRHATTWRYDPRDPARERLEQGRQ